MKFFFQKSFFWAPLIGTICSPMIKSQEISPVELPEKNPHQQWKDSKFGMFIHWGVYSVPAGVHNGKEIGHSAEWIMRRAGISKKNYRKYAARFDPKDYDPAAWVALAKDAGMRYIVATAKHHDGFAMYDSAVSDWNSVDASAAKRDLLMPLVEECRRQEMALGFHYSQAQDWWHPGGGMTVPAWDPSQEGSFDHYLSSIAVPQIQELIANYGPVHCFFFDTPRGMTSVNARQIEKILPPSIITNDRLYTGSRGSYRSYERRFPNEFFPRGSWEFCLPISNSWGFKSHSQDWKSGHRLKRTLIETVSRGGNFLLNVGPDSSGVIPAEAVTELEDVGRWMRTNSESIYGTRRSLYAPIPWQGGCTTRVLSDEKSEVYCHLFRWPKDGKLILPGLTNEVLSARILGQSQDLAFKRSGNSWELTIPAFDAPEIPVVKITAVGRLALAPPSAVVGADGSFSLRAATAVLQGEKLRTERQSDSIVRNIGSWTSLDNSVSWSISLSRSASYSTEWAIACAPESAGAVIALMIGDEELAQFEIPATGGWSNFQKVTGPTVSLPAGTSEIRLVPISKPGQRVVNLRALNFTKSN